MYSPDRKPATGPESWPASRGASPSKSPGPVIEVVEFPRAAEEQVPLKELGTVLSGSRQTEESREGPRARSEDDEVDLSDAAKATLPKYRRAGQGCEYQGPCFVVGACMLQPFGCWSWRCWSTGVCARL